MTPEQQQFLDDALLGRFDDLEALLQKGSEVGRLTDEAVVSLSRGTPAPARMAAIEYGRGRSDPSVLRALELLADDPQEPVRHQLAIAIREQRYWWQHGKSVETLLRDSSGRVRRQ